jgi:hypothetical protein
MGAEIPGAPTMVGYHPNFIVGMTTDGSGRSLRIFLDGNRLAAEPFKNNYVKEIR